MTSLLEESIYTSKTSVILLKHQKCSEMKYSCVSQHIVFQNAFLKYYISKNYHYYNSIMLMCTDTLITKIECNAQNT